MERERKDGLPRFHSLRLDERRELTLGVVERGPENDACGSEKVDKESREKKTEGERERGRGNYGKDKGKSTLMRRAKTKASIPREPIYDRAAIRYKCICATRNPYELRGDSGWRKRRDRTGWSTED